MTPTLETERLLLCPLALDDAAQVQRVFPCWQIVQHLNGGIPWPFPEDGVQSFYRDVALPDSARGNAWQWTLRLRTAPDAIIGALSLHRNEDANRGFWLAPDEHGHGLMTEAVFATNDYWFDVLGFPVLRSGRAVANVASRRVAEKTGMHVVAIFEGSFVCGRLPMETWEITADAWRAWRQRRG